MRAWLPLCLFIAACGDDRDGNRSPIVGELSLSTLEDVPVTQAIDAVDNDIGDVLVARVVAQPDHGTVTFAGLALTYSPAANYHGNDRFTFAVSDGVDETPVDVRVSVGTLNDPPIGGADSLATNEDTPRKVPVVVLLSNDTDADGDPITLTAVGNAVNGTVNLGAGEVTFVPGPNFKGGGSFRYEISDGELTSSVLVDVVVGGVNDAPVANDDSGFTTADITPLTIQGTTLLANDTDADGQTLTILSVANGTGGTVALNGGNPIFTPTANFSGTATFTYLAFDGIATDSATVTVTVTSSNDAPTALNDTATTNEDTAVTIAVLTNDSDTDGPSPLAVQSVANASGGTAVINGDNTITFTPTANFAGPTATFDYVVTDGQATDTAIVTITITPVNDPVTAVDDTGFSTDEKTPITLTTLTANDTDVDIATQGQTLSITAVGNAVNGSVALVAGQPVFTPTTNAASNQTGTFEYTVSDGNGSTDVGLVTITITPVNDPPVAVDDSGSTNEDTAVTFSTLTGNDTDPEGQTLTIQSVSNAVNGTVVLNGDGTVTFTPTANFPGPTASFDYVVSDGAGGTDTATVTITVNPVNDAVTAVDDPGFTTNEKTPITFTTLTANDTDVDIATQGQTLTVSAVSNAVNGTVALNGGQPIFTPNTNSASNQTGSFEYTVSDGSGSTDVGLVTITITPVNDPPVAVNDAVSQIDSATDFAHTVFLANDSDGGDGAALTITAVSDATNGSVALNASTITFTPTAVGPASFTYTVSDGGAVTSTATVNITVVDCGDGQVDGPETCDDGNNLDDDGCSATCKVETGFTCDNSEPSVCTPICGDGLVKGTEECDDGPGNTDETDGCTTKCVTAVPCAPSDFTLTAPLTSVTTAVDPATGHCYARFTNTGLPHFESGAQCVAFGGHLVTITSADEQAVLAQATSGAPGISWLGGFDDANDTDKLGTWITGEPFGFNDWDTNEPAFPGVGCFANISIPDPVWVEFPCSFLMGEFTCELEPEPCGDGIVQPVLGEECDDRNLTSGDGCSSTCQIDTGCGNGTLDPGEECDDDNIVGGDGCSATCQTEVGCGNGVLEVGEQCDDDNKTNGDGCSSTCQFETLTQFSFTGAAGNEATFNADFANLATLPVMGRGPGITPSGSANTFSGASWTTAATLDANDFYTFTITPNVGTTVNLQRIGFDERRSGTGPRQWALRSSLDNFTANIALFAIPNDLNIRNHVINLPLFTGLSVPIQLRLFAFEAGAATGTWRIDNVIVFGGSVDAMRLWAPVLLLAACGDDIEGNRPPIVEPFTLSTQEDLPTTKLIDVVDLDVGNVATARVPVPPPHGNVEITGLSLTYLPAPDYHGNDRFDLLVGDGLDETTVSIRVAVESVPDQPIGIQDALATNEDAPRTVAIESLLANDSDADGDRITLVSVGDATDGTVSVNQATKAITFTPALNFNGTASFVYTITDGMFETPVTVEVVVGATNDPPMAIDDLLVTTMGVPLVVSAVSLLANDIDPEGQVLSISTVGGATNGSVTFDGTGVTFTPAAIGPASFQYTAFDGIAGTVATVSIQVL